jgi:branched-chain amino acid transport system permease protein
MRAVAENPVVAQLQGVNVARITMITFFVSALLAGAAGVFIGLRIGKLSPFIGTSVGLKALAVVIIGGLGNNNGAMLAGLLVGMLEILASAYLGAAYSDAIPWTLLIIILVFRPSGLLGSKTNVDRA